jgi:hypothetical protein
VESATGETTMVESAARESAADAPFARRSE